MLELAETLGVPMNHSKTVEPTTCLTVVGIEMDTMLMQLRLPEDKLIHATELCEQFKKKKKSHFERTSVTNWLPKLCM